VGDRIFETAMTIGLAIIAVAFIAVIVGRNAQTAGVINASTSGIAQDLQAAEAPVS
jgi:PRD1 phage membrane DNA delivery